MLKTKIKKPLNAIPLAPELVEIVKQRQLEVSMLAGVLIPLTQITSELMQRALSTCEPQDSFFVKDDSMDEGYFEDDDIDNKLKQCATGE